MFFFIQSKLKTVLRHKKFFKGYFIYAISFMFLFIAFFSFLNMSYVLDPFKEYQYHLSGKSGSLDKLFVGLKADKIIRSRNFIRVLSLLIGYDRRAKAGFYTFNNRMSTWEILTTLVSGKEAYTVLTIKEGADIYDISILMETKKVVTSRKEAVDFFKSFWVRHEINEKLRILVNNSCEGFLYPDTYYLRKTDTITNFFILALDNFSNQIIGFSKSKNLSPLKIYQKIKIASLIEKETSLQREKPLVSSVLYNRLKRKEKLRYDPTIIYALKEKGLYELNLKKGAINIKRRHYYLNSRYNTYYYKGLPIGPICSPSLDSFKGAINPAKTEYLFFVAKGDGSKSHFFSKTYKEHQKNIKLYLRELRKRKR